MLLEMGVRVWLPGTSFATVDAAVVAEPPAMPPAVPPAPPQRPVAKVAPVVPAVTVQTGDLQTLEAPALEQAARQCRDCGLCEGRQKSTLRLPVAQTLAGHDSLAHWMVVGDAPDEEEDAAGSAFAGQSGVLLDNMLRALQLQRINPHSASDPAQPDQPRQPAIAPAAIAPHKAAYVTNVVKCRPPHGKLPQAAELAQCSAYLQREIALVRPRMILSMGRFANQLLLSESPALAAQPLGKLRGSVRHYAGVPVVVTYHPKALLRNSMDKAKAWADLCLAADMLEASSPG